MNYKIVANHKQFQDGRAVYRDALGYFKGKAFTQVELQEAISGLVNNKLLSSTHDGAEGYNSKFNDYVDIIEGVGVTLEDDLIKYLYLANIHDDTYEHIKDQTSIDNLSLMEVQSPMLKKYTSYQAVKGRVYRQNLVHHTEQENFDIVSTSTQLKTTHGRTSPSGNGKSSPKTSSTSENDPHLIDKHEWANLTQNTKDKINAMRRKIKDLKPNNANIHLQTSEEPNQIASNVETSNPMSIMKQQLHFGPFQDTVRQFILRANGQQHAMKSTLSSHLILRQVITPKYGRLISDSGAETSALSVTYAHILATHDMEISIDGCHLDKSEIYKLCDKVVAIDIGTSTYLLGLRSVPLIPKSVGLLMSELQVRANGVQVDSTPKSFGGKGLIIVEDIQIP